MQNAKCRNGEKTGGEKCGKMYNACINTKMLVKIHKWGGGCYWLFCMFLYKITFFFLVVDFCNKMLYNIGGIMPKKLFQDTLKEN